jgi:hypothetical protein
MLLSGIPLFKVMSKDFALLTSQKISVPCQPSGRRFIPPGPPSVHCSIRPDDVPYRPDAQTYLASFVRTTYREAFADSTSTFRTPAFHGPNACTVNMKIACWRSTVRTAIPLGSDTLKPYMEITCSGHTTVRTTVSHCSDAALKQERFSAKISKILVTQLSVRTAQVHRPDGVRTYYCNRPLEPSAYK